MAAKTWFVTSNLVSVHQEMADGADPGTEVFASPVVGWIVSTGATNHSPLKAGGPEQAAATFVNTTPPSGTIDTTNGDCFRSNAALTGSFAAGNWSVFFACRANTNGGTQDGRMRCRLFRGPNANGSGATQITGAQQLGSLVTDLLTSATQVSTATFNPGAFSVNNEFIFIQIAWERTGAGAMTTSDVNLRVGNASGTGSRVTSPNFTADVVMSDSVSVTDAIARTETSSRTMSDSVAVTDSITAQIVVNAITREFSDSISVTDAISAAMSFTRAMSDTIAVTDAIVTAMAFERSMSDSVSVTDAITAALSQAISLSDSVSVTDAISAAMSFARTMSDTVSVTDSLTAQLDTGTSDTITVIDNTTTSVDYSRNLSDSVDVTDNISAQIVGADTVISDTIDVTDQLQVAADYSRLMSDSIAVTDAIAAEAGASREFSDTISVTDSLQRSADFGRSTTDAVSVTETLQVTLTFGASGSDTITVDDDFSVSADYLRNLSDAVAVTDSITAVIVGTISVELSDSISVTDSITAQKIGVQTGEADDDVGVTDGIDVELIRPVVPPTPPVPPKPKPKKKKKQQQVFTSGGSQQTGHAYNCLDFDWLERLVRQDPCEAIVPVVVPRPSYEAPPSPWAPPRPEPAPKVVSYIDSIDQSQRQRFIENKQDQRDQRVVTYNFGSSPETDTLKTLLLVAFGVGLAVLIWSIATAPAAPAPAAPPRRARSPRL